MLILLACWIGLSLAVLPLVLFLGRAGQQADAEAERLHVRAASARTDAEPAAPRHRALQT